MHAAPRTLLSLISAWLLSLGSSVGLAHAQGARTQRPPACDADNGGVTLPRGFCALVVADVNGRARHLVVRPNGDILVAVFARMQQGQMQAPGGVVALRDTTGDGKADVRVRFGPERGGSGIDIAGEQLYFAPNDAVLRYRIPAGSLTPSGGPDTIVSGLPATMSHTAKTVVVAPGNRLFVNIGSPSNSCQQQERTNASPGQDPCPQLERRAGIWLFDANRTGQSQDDGQRFATGIRNAVAVTFNSSDSSLYAMQHGRDQLFQNWPHIGYTERDGAEKPAEEFLKVERGDDFGWPYCYYDPDADLKVLAPEYGGDGKREGRCAEKKDPIHDFPGHWAPNDVVFYTGTQFPQRYRGGAFVAFHGSWNRAPLPQDGFNIAFLPFQEGRPAAEHEIFADGFAGPDKDQAKYRPTGLAVGPDGSLYVTDDAGGGRIWRIIYRGN